MTRTQDFRWSMFSWHELEILPLTDIINSLENILNTNLKIKNYGNSLDFIFFAPIIMIDCYNHPNRKKYSRKSKYLSICLQMDYNRAFHATKEELQELMAILYLESIKKYKSWHIKDFDSDKFYQDVRSVWLDNQIVRLSELEKAHEWVSIPI
jgi:Immunity protein 44